MKKIHLIVAEDYGDQGVNPVCICETRELAEKKTDRLKEEFLKKWKFDGWFDILEMDCLETEDDV